MAVGDRVVDSGVMNSSVYEVVGIKKRISLRLSLSFTLSYIVVESSVDVGVDIVVDRVHGGCVGGGHSVDSRHHGDRVSVRSHSRNSNMDRGHMAVSDRVVDSGVMNSSVYEVVGINKRISFRLSICLTLSYIVVESRVDVGEDSGVHIVNSRGNIGSNIVYCWSDHRCYRGSVGHMVDGSVTNSSQS